MGLLESLSYSELARHGPGNEQPESISVQLTRSVDSFPELRRWPQVFTHSAQLKCTKYLLSAVIVLSAIQRTVLPPSRPFSTKHFLHLSSWRQAAPALDSTLL